jgi:hypothetical protein
LLNTGAGGLTQRAQRLAQLMDSMETGSRANGSAVTSVRKKTKKAGNTEGV